MRFTNFRLIVLSAWVIVAHAAIADDKSLALERLGKAIAERNEVAVAGLFKPEAKIDVFYISEQGPGQKYMTVSEFAKYIVQAWPSAKRIERSQKVTERKSASDGAISEKTETTERVFRSEKDTSTNKFVESVEYLVKDGKPEILVYSQGPPM